MSEEFNDHTMTQMKKIAEDLNNIQMQYDTRLVAATMAGRAAMLHAIMINAEVMTQEDALAAWNEAGKLIETPPERETKVVRMMSGEMFDESKVN